MGGNGVFNTLMILLEVVLFSGIVGTALAIRRRRRKTAEAIAPVPAAPVKPGEMTPEEHAERRLAVAGTAVLMFVFAIAMLAGVAIYVVRHRPG